MTAMPQTSGALIEVAHYSEVVLGVLIEVFRLDCLAPTRRLLSQREVPLIVVARVRRQVSRIAGMTNRLRSRCRLWRLLVLVTLRPIGPSARTLVQDILRLLNGTTIQATQS